VLVLVCFVFVAACFDLWKRRAMQDATRPQKPHAPRLTQKQPPQPPHSKPNTQQQQSLRAYLRQLASAAYRQKAAAVDGLEPGLMAEAQRFFVLTQTDNLWKEHLQVCGRVVLWGACRVCAGRGGCSV
jgi:preprotein translocase subunit SecA